MPDSAARRNPERTGPVRPPKVRAEPAPAELPLVAAIAQDSIHDEQDQLRAAIHNDADVVRRAGLQQAGIRAPGGSGTAVMHCEVQYSAGIRAYSEALSVGCAAIEQNLPCIQG